jgi:hypothetical protein
MGRQTLAQRLSWQYFLQMRLPERQADGIADTGASGNAAVELAAGPGKQPSHAGPPEHQRLTVAVTLSER